jgi:hypothetical protein
MANIDLPLGVLGSFGMVWDTGGPLMFPYCSHGLDRDPVARRKGNQGPSPSTGSTPGRPGARYWERKAKSRGPTARPIGLAIENFRGSGTVSRDHTCCCRLMDGPLAAFSGELHSGKPPSGAGEKQHELGDEGCVEAP